MASPEQLAALKAVAPAAQASFAKWRVPASVTLAQWIFESTWGTSKLALLAKNYFGIKAMHVNAPETYEEFPTGEYENGKRVIVEALFEKFPDEAGSFDVHGQLLANAARYKPAMAVSPNPYAFAVALAKGGYSTTPDYAIQLIGAIHEYNLTQYDTLPPAAAKAA